MRFVKLMTVFFTLQALLGCASVNLETLSDMLGLSKRTYSVKAPPSVPESTTAATAGATVPPNPAPTSTTTQVLIPPANTNTQVNAKDFVSYRVAAAKKIMQSNASAVFQGAIPEPLASIPVLEIVLRADGSVQDIVVLRTPHFYPETIELAIAAIHKAAPFGSVAHLPRPWQFNETFLFNDDLKFQLHTLQP